VTAVFYITGHGFGHASRVIEVINALLVRQPDLKIIIRSKTARWLFDLTVKGAFSYVGVECDTGIVQIDSLRLDEQASIARAVAFMSTFDARVDAEVSALRQIVPAFVLSDIPALGIAAAARAGIPSIAMGNFTWDWAYSAYPGSERVVRAIAAAYAHADMTLRLPMWGGFDAFPNVIDLPFVARRSTRDPEETRRAFGLSTSKKLVLPSFGGHGLHRLDRARTPLEGYQVLFDFDENKLYADGFRYEDLVRAADVVVTKPGYGIIAECLANDTALLYTDRGHFIEYDVLVEAMPRVVRAAHIGHDDLFAGRWQSHLDALLAQPAPSEHPATNGAELAADLLLAIGTRPV
jgi:UDP:flavonoid glycosyltransferase YjiC (YdhE family)